MIAASAMASGVYLSSLKPNQPACADRNRNPSTASSEYSVQFRLGWTCRRSGDIHPYRPL